MSELDKCSEASLEQYRATIRTAEDMVLKAKGSLERADAVAVLEQAKSWYQEVVAGCEPCTVWKRMTMTDPGIRTRPWKKGSEQTCSCGTPKPDRYISFSVARYPWKNTGELCSPPKKIVAKNIVRAETRVECKQPYQERLINKPYGIQ